MTDWYRGEGLYAHNCQACHGTGASGGMGPKLAGNPILEDESRFWDTVLHGRGAMPPWASALTAQEVSDVWVYLRTLK
ncbi:MAG: c-type cytochrome [Anaerolineales bacterium]